MSYQASAALEKFILDACPLHYATPEAPETYLELCEYYPALVSGDPIPVQSEGCEFSIYSQESINQAWRAYHDGIHLLHQLNFSLDDEVETCEVQVRHMQEYANEYGFTDEDYAAVRADVIGQAMYYDKYKEFVRDQAAFVQSCLDNGVMATLETRW